MTAALISETRQYRYAKNYDFISFEEGYNIHCFNHAAAAEGVAADTGFESDVPYANYSFESKF